MTLNWIFSKICFFLFFIHLNIYTCLELLNLNAVGPFWDKILELFNKFLKCRFFSTFYKNFLLKSTGLSHFQNTFWIQLSSKRSHQKFSLFPTDMFNKNQFCIEPINLKNISINFPLAETSENILWKSFCLW